MTLMKVFTETIIREFYDAEDFTTDEAVALFPDKKRNTIRRYLLRLSKDGIIEKSRDRWVVSQNTHITVFIAMLQEIAKANPKIKIFRGKLRVIDKDGLAVALIL